MSHHNPYGSKEAELEHLRLRRDQREATGGVYADVTEIEARIAQLEAEDA
jgi:hypothetical protein